MNGGTCEEVAGRVWCQCVSGYGGPTCEQCESSQSSRMFLTLVFRPHRLHAVHRCGLLLQMSHVAWSVRLSVCLCVLSTRMGCAKRLN